MAQSWRNISAARQGLRRWWSILGGLLLLFMLLQTVFGQYSGIESTAWLWLAVHLLPGLGMVYLGAWLQVHPHKLVSLETTRALRWLSIGYLLVLLATLLLSQAAVDRNAWGLDTYLRKSLWWTTPLNIISLAGLLVFYFRKESLRRPGAETIRDMARQQGAAINADQQPLRQLILALIADSDLPTAFTELRSYYQQATEQNQLVVLQSEYTSLQEQERMNVIDPEEAQRKTNRIAWALLTLTGGVEQ